MWLLGTRNVTVGVGNMLFRIMNESIGYCRPYVLPWRYFLVKVAALISFKCKCS